MRLSTTWTLLALGAVARSSSWSFSDGSVTVVSKSAGTAAQDFTETQPAKMTVKLGQQEAVQVSLKIREDSKPKRPHQAFLVLRDPVTDLQVPFALTVNPSGEGKVQFAQKDLPAQLLTGNSPLEARLVLGSFGSAEGSVKPVFKTAIELDASAPGPSYEAPLRYGKLPEIHHIFRADAKSPPKVVSLVFSLAVLATLPMLLAGWLALGANLCHAQKALSSAPASHAVFFGSIIAMEGVFFLYYCNWNLFKTLPAMAVVASVAFLSGRRALGEVQSRREAGER